MAAGIVPHLANDQGVEKIFVGVRELQCMGARPPFDHPHIFIDMGADTQALCPYCSTLFIYDADKASMLRMLQTSYIEDSDDVFIEDWRKRPLWRRAAEAGARLLGPLL